MAATKPRHVSTGLNLPSRVTNIGACAQSILAALTANASFPIPTPALAAGVAAAAAYFFRFRGITKAGTGDWSGVVSLLVT
jgi:energy-converting hydrogenase Eha subunit A